MSQNVLAFWEVFTVLWALWTQNALYCATKFDLWSVTAMCFRCMYCDTNNSVT